MPREALMKRVKIGLDSWGVVKNRILVHIQYDLRMSDLHWGHSGLKRRFTCRWIGFCMEIYEQIYHSIKGDERGRSGMSAKTVWGPLLHDARDLHGSGPSDNKMIFRTQPKWWKWILQVLPEKMQRERYFHLQGKQLSLVLNNWKFMELLRTKWRLGDFGQAAKLYDASYVETCKVFISLNEKEMWKIPLLLVE